MSHLGIELTFPDDDMLQSWLSSTPPHGFELDIEPGFIPNDAPSPPPVSALLGAAPTDDLKNPLIIHTHADGWNAAAALAHAVGFGAVGRAVITDVPYGWVEDGDDPRDSIVHILMTLSENGERRDQTLSGRQAKAFAEATGVPTLKQIKEHLRGLRKKRS